VKTKYYKEESTQVVKFRNAVFISFLFNEERGACV